MHVLVVLSMVVANEKQHKRVLILFCRLNFSVNIVKDFVLGLVSWTMMDNGDLLMCLRGSHQG